jgi:hypothetical protein
LIESEREERRRAAMEPTRKEVEGGRAAAMASPKRKRSSQGKQRINICYITNKDRRQVTFSKRRKGLFKKASELAQLCAAHVAVIVFSTAERPKAFAIGAPSVDEVRSNCRTTTPAARGWRRRCGRQRRPGRSLWPSRCGWTLSGRR